MPRRRSYFLKYMTMFFLGASAVLLSTQASILNIDTTLQNAVQFISQVIITSDGSNAGSTGIILDGNGNAFFSGNVGIGTTGPTAKFEVNAGGSIGLSPVQGNTYISLKNDPSDLGFIVGFGDVSFGHRGVLYNFDGGGISLGATVNVTGGNVGINTNHPSEKLEVNGSIKLSTAGWIGSTQNQIYFANNGNVGIGTNNPSKQLDVVKGDSSISMGQGVPGISSLIVNSNSSTQTGFEMMQFAWQGVLWNADGDIHLLAGGVLRDGALVITTGDRIGIGTNNPLAKLEVNGGIKAKTWANVDPCATNPTDYPRGTMFFVPKHTVSGKNLPDMYCICDESQVATPIGGAYNNELVLATVCF